MDADLKFEPLFFLGSRAESYRQMRADSDLTFVHYTSSSTLFSIVEHKAVWMRNARLMNDFSEIDHGLQAIRLFLQNEEENAPFRNSVEAVFSGAFEKLIETIDLYEPDIYHATYLTCLSEHSYAADEAGKLSMWRGYGRSGVSVGIVLRKEAVMLEEGPYGIDGFPVEYVAPKELWERLIQAGEILSGHAPYYRAMGEFGFINHLFKAVQILLCTSKHPGFKEEREWRLIYLPYVYGSDGMESHRLVTSAGGIPQVIYRIPIDGEPINSSKATTVKELVDRVIIGPCDSPLNAVQAVTFLLHEGAGISDPKVEHCGIPFREV